MTESQLVGNPTILVVDDEELMREVVSIMIEENGGSVIEAVHGLDAVQKFRENPEGIDCVFMDFSMPEMNGYEAYLEIRRMSNAVEFVMVSGLQVTPEINELCKADSVTFLSKPFHEEDLIAAINERIERRR